MGLGTSVENAATVIARAVATFSFRLKDIYNFREKVLGK